MLVLEQKSWRIVEPVQLHETSEKTLERCRDHHLTTSQSQPEVLTVATKFCILLYW